MGKLTNHQTAVVRLLERYSQTRYINAPNLEQQVVADTERNHYQLVDIGWDQGRFTLDVAIHIDLVDGKVLIRQNWTDLKLKQLLIEQGVDPNDIIIEWANPTHSTVS